MGSRRSRADAALYVCQKEWSHTPLEGFMSMNESDHEHERNRPCIMNGLNHVS